MEKALAKLILTEAFSIVYIFKNKSLRNNEFPI
jgi:hypothetical protein